jgi:hypothetical protein
MYKSKPNNRFSCPMAVHKYPPYQDFQMNLVGKTASGNLITMLKASVKTLGQHFLMKEYNQHALSQGSNSF